MAVQPLEHLLERRGKLLGQIHRVDQQIGKHYPEESRPCKVCGKALSAERLRTRPNAVVCGATTCRDTHYRNLRRATAKSSAERRKTLKAAEASISQAEDTGYWYHSIITGQHNPFMTREAAVQNAVDSLNALHEVEQGV